MEDRIIELEKKAAFQDAEIKDLSSAVMRQHKEIEALTKSLILMKEKVQSGALVKELKDEEPPPHY